MTIRMLGVVVAVVVVGACKKDNASATVASTADVTTAHAPAQPPDAAPVDPGPPPPVPDGARAGGSAADAAAELEIRRFGDVLTADDGSQPWDDRSGRQGDMLKRRRGADLGAQIEAVREQGSGIVSAGRPPAGRIKLVSRLALDQDSTLTVATVVARLQTLYMAGLERCYQQLLANQPAARGTIDLYLTVGPDGGAERITVKSFDAGHERCVQGQMQSWRFPVPKAPDGDPLEASFELSLQHAPE